MGHVRHPRIKIIFSFNSYSYVEPNVFNQFVTFCTSQSLPYQVIVVLIIASYINVDLGDDGAHGFLHERIYESRYKTFLETAFANPPSIDLSLCDQLSKNSTGAIDAKSINGEDVDEGEELEQYVEEIEEINGFLRDKIVPEFEAIRSYGRDGVMDLLLDYYIEGVVELMFGVSNVPYYFDKCLQQ